MNDPGVAERPASPDALWDMAPWCVLRMKGSSGWIGSSLELQGVDSGSSGRTEIALAR